MTSGQNVGNSQENLRTPLVDELQRVWIGFRDEGKKVPEYCTAEEEGSSWNRSCEGMGGSK